MNIRASHGSDRSGSLESRFRAGVQALVRAQGFEAKNRAAAAGRLASGPVASGSTATSAADAPVVGGSGKDGVDTLPTHVEFREASRGWVAEVEGAKQDAEIGEDLSERETSLRLDASLTSLGKTGSTPAVLRGVEAYKAAAAASAQGTSPSALAAAGAGSPQGTSASALDAGGAPAPGSLVQHAA